MMLKFGSALLGATALVSLGAVSAPAQVDEFTVNGYIGAELRAFFDDAEWPGQDDQTLFPSLYAMLDVNYNWDGNQRIQAAPYIRFDFNDDRRTHADFRELYYAYQGDGWDALIGAHTVFWGRAESRHLVNVINQIDFVENFDGEDYLGQ